MSITIVLNKPYFHPTAAQITEKFNHTLHCAHTQKKNLTHTIPFLFYRHS